MWSATTYYTEVRQPMIHKNQTPEFKKKENTNILDTKKKRKKENNLQKRQKKQKLKEKLEKYINGKSSFCGIRRNFLPPPVVAN